MLQNRCFHCAGTSNGEIGQFDTHVDSQSSVHGLSRQRRLKIGSVCLTSSAAPMMAVSLVYKKSPFFLFGVPPGCRVIILFRCYPAINLGQAPKSQLMGGLFRNGYTVSYTKVLYPLLN